MSFSLEARHVFATLNVEVIDQGLCTHCGTCVGLSSGLLCMEETEKGPVPVAIGSGEIKIDPAAYVACPGKGLNYPDLNRFTFGRLPENWLVGNVRRSYVGFANDDQVRRNGASGGVISACLIYLLEKRMVDGAIMLRQGYPKPYLATPVVARSRKEVLDASQSVYVPAPVNTILAELQHLEGRFAYVGLPDQVASIRKLQQLNYIAAKKIKYVFGLYFGTMMYFEAIRSFLRSHGVRDEKEIQKLRYREGEWPGKLHIVTKSGQVISAEKFYYNYLIPFYITQSSLLSVDFTNELADISVGDAWHPHFEKDRKGYSVVLARTLTGESFLKQVSSENVLSLDEQSTDFVQSMHGHMLDFKKRGAFLRFEKRIRAGKRVPNFGYRPVSINPSRRFVEFVIGLLFSIGGTRWARLIVQYIPLSVIGPLFNFIRKSWKNISKPAKRKGLSAYQVELVENECP